MNELRAAEKFLENNVPAGAGVLCAVSGGLDSMCLLDFTRTWAAGRDGFAAAAHFNHHLRGDAADRDEAFVRDYCAEKGIPFFSGGGDVRALAEAEGLSVEEAARRLRYEFLERTAAEQGFAHILTAHHADDNAETMLFNLCRGTGSAGLGIPAARGRLLRPFLELSKAELADYAAARGVPHVEDETNNLDDAARNLLRHKVLPVLKEVNPRAVEHMARAARLLAEEDAYLRAEAEKRLEGAGNALPWAALEGAPPALRGRMVLSLLARVSGHQKDLTAAHAAAVLALRPGGQASLPYGLAARRTEKALVVEKAAAPPEPAALRPGGAVRFGEWTVALGGGGEAPGPAYLLAASVLNGSLRVTAWRSGDRMTLPGSRGSRTLKRLWADAGVPPGLRDGMPVLRLGEIPAAAPQIGIEERFAPSAGEAAAWVAFYKETKENRDEK